MDAGRKLVDAPVDNINWHLSSVLGGRRLLASPSNTKTTFRDPKTSNLRRSKMNCVVFSSEFLRDPDDHLKLTEDTRNLGLVVCRGPTIIIVHPQDSMEQISNPFVQ